MRDSRSSGDCPRALPASTDGRRRHLNLISAMGTTASRYDPKGKTAESRVGARAWDRCTPTAFTVVARRKRLDRTQGTMRGKDQRKSSPSLDEDLKGE